MKLSDLCDSKDLRTHLAAVQKYSVQEPFPHGLNNFSVSIPLSIPLHVDGLNQLINSFGGNKPKSDTPLLEVFEPLRRNLQLEDAPAFYMREPESLSERIGLGYLSTLKSKDASSSPPSLSFQKEVAAFFLKTHPQAATLRFVCGSQFNPTHTNTDIWKDFAPAHMYVPNFWLERTATTLKGWLYLSLACIPHTQPAAEADNVESIDKEIDFSAQRNAATPARKNQFFTNTFNVLRPLATVEYGGCRLAPVDEIEEILNRSWYVPNHEPIDDEPALIFISDRKELPDDKNLSESIDHTIQRIKDVESLSKVVIARQISVQCSRSPSATTTIKRIINSNYGTAFIFIPGKSQHGPDSILCGVSPECLVRVSNNLVECEAVGGSVSRGDSEVEDIALATKLRTDDKLLREHDNIVAFLEEALSRLSYNSQVVKHCEVLVLHCIQHLRSLVRGTVPPETLPHEYAFALHPTPAVCGSPTAEARAIIDLYEPFDRGWYTGFLGWASLDAAYATPTLRSLLLCGNVAHLFAGAGIVLGSNPSTEIDEIEKKLAAGLSALVNQR